MSFPTCGRFWKIYIEEELKAKNYKMVEKVHLEEISVFTLNLLLISYFLKLFSRSLNNVLQIDLWKCYIAYVKESQINQENFK